MKESGKENTIKAVNFPGHYEYEYSDKLKLILLKLQSKDFGQFVIVKKNIRKVVINPNHRFKFLKHDKKGKNRIHIGHFVLVFRIDYENKTVYFDDYEHHDKVYK